jgi:transcription elongation factor Elf1
MEDFYSIKNNTNNDYDIKRPNKYKNKSICPFCNHVMKIKILNGFKYCNICHEQLPGFVIINNFSDTNSVKELKNE